MKAKFKTLIAIELILLFVFVPVDSSTITTYPELEYSPNLVLGSYIWNVVNFTITSGSKIATTYDPAKELANISLITPYGTSLFQLSNTSIITVQIQQSIANKSLTLSQFATYFKLSLTKGYINPNDLVIFIEREYDNTIKDYGNGTTAIIGSQYYFDSLNQIIYSGLQYYQNFTTSINGNQFELQVNHGTYIQTQFYDRSTSLLERLSVTDGNENITVISANASVLLTSNGTIVKDTSTRSITVGLDFVPYIVLGLFMVTLISKRRKKT